MKKLRKTRLGEVVCTCPAYDFPHRFSGGRCTGAHLAEDYFFGGDCRDCNYLDESSGYRACQVIDGADAVTECPVWREFVRSNEVKLYGPKYYCTQI